MVGKTDTALGVFYRRLSSRIGKAKAVTATARKIAVLFYNALRHGMARRIATRAHLITSNVTSNVCWTICAVAQSRWDTSFKKCPLIR